MQDGVTIIEPAKTFRFKELRELWPYRGLAYFLAWRDLKVRYKQTAVGVAWAVFQPLFAMIIFSFIFGYFVKVPTNGVPYPIFVYAGLLLWQFFSGALTDISNSLVNNRDLLTKIYFPRLILPCSAMVSKSVDFLVASVLLAALTIYYGYLPGIYTLFVFPILAIITLGSALGLGLFLAALNVKYRDIKYILPYFIQIMFFVTPIVYPADIAGRYSWVLSINPMTGAIKALRSALFNDVPMPWFQLGIAAIVCLMIFLFGLYYFRKTEEYFADII